MWTLLNKQVLKRQSAACAQNGAATIKCLGQDVHQSVVFQKIPNKSSPSINGRTSQRKSYSAVHASGEKWRGAILHYTRATAANTCGRVAATWATPPGTWLGYLSGSPCTLQKNNKRMMQHSTVHASCINQQSEKIYSSSVTWTYLNVSLFFSKRKQTKLKSALKSKRCVRYKVNLYHTSGYYYKFIINLWF